MAWYRWYRRYHVRARALILSLLPSGVRRGRGSADRAVQNPSSWDVSQVASTRASWKRYVSPTTLAAAWGTCLGLAAVGSHLVEDGAARMATSRIDRAVSITEE